jgi:hypothetical protein
VHVYLVIFYKLFRQYTLIYTQASKYTVLDQRVDNNLYLADNLIDITKVAIEAVILKSFT